MKPELQPGIETTFDIIVTEEMRPQFDGVVVHNVMSTVSMIYYMERAGRQLLLQYLDEDEDHAGFAIDVKHVGPAVVGQRVTFFATCAEIMPKRVVCQVRAETDCNVVGEGVFTQAVFKKATMKDRVAHLTAQVDESQDSP